MEFCPNCGCVMIKDGDSSKCPRCEYKSKDKINLESSENIKLKSQVAVINEEDSNFLPEVDAECPKCKNNKASFWTLQTRSSDEAETKFFRCTKCKHTWRVYK
ncbi:MAG: transcription factor S [Candidatus Nanoarchaeia archaeon]|nr:transcription factor S [Candidatus Nanoarchaeia archaeon]MDD5740445.1 transcription factor S [Candidatus Nanoarchaeia archaeon]